MADLPKLDVVIGNNFGHLPLFIGAEQGFFKKHAVDAKMLVVDTGTDMVNAMHAGRAKMKYEELTIENIWSQFGLAPALAEGKVDAVVSWEPYVTQVLTQVPDSYEVIRGGQHMSYVMVATAHGPTIESKPELAKAIAAGLAQSSHFTRNNRDEAVEIFAKWVPGTDVAIGKKAIRHISFDPRMSPNVMRAFENAEDEVLMNTLKGAPRLDVPSLFRPKFMAEVEKEHPEYFADLPKLK